MNNTIETNAMSHKDMTKHIRTRIGVADIKARVRMYVACGTRYIQVFGSTHDAEFTEDQQRKIRMIAKVNGLTWVRGMEIDIEQMTDPRHFDFVFPNR